MSFRISIIGFPPFPVDGLRLLVKTQPPKSVTRPGEKVRFHLFWNSNVVLLKHTDKTKVKKQGLSWDNDGNVTWIPACSMDPDPLHWACSGFGMAPVISKQLESSMTFIPAKFETFIDLFIQPSMMRIVDWTILNILSVPNEKEQTFKGVPTGVCWGIENCKELFGLGKLQRTLRSDNSKRCVFNYTNNDLEEHIVDCWAGVGELRLGMLSYVMREW